MPQRYSSTTTTTTTSLPEDTQAHTARPTCLVEALVNGYDVAVAQESDGNFAGELEAVPPATLAAPPHQARVMRRHEEILEPLG